MCLLMLRALYVKTGRSPRSASEISKSIKCIKSQGKALNRIGKNKSKIYFLPNAGMENKFSIIGLGT